VYTDLVRVIILTSILLYPVLAVFSEIPWNILIRLHLVSCVLRGGTGLVLIPVHTLFIEVMRQGNIDNGGKFLFFTRTPLNTTFIDRKY